MIKDVFINIKGIQGLDQDTDTIEFMTEGRFGIKDGEYYLSYDEIGMYNSGEKVKTQIFIKSKDSLVLQRSGSIKSRMLIEKGTRNTSQYSTLYGDFAIGILGEKIEYNLTEKGGKIKLKYTIDSDLRLISRNEVNITIKEV